MSQLYIASTIIYKGLCIIIHATAFIVYSFNLITISKYMCVQYLLKINYVSYYLPITDFGKLSGWSFDRSDLF